MVDITLSVGKGNAQNKVHDVAIVQLMLRVVKRANNQPYLAGTYDGGIGPITRTAIKDFQDAHNLLTAPPGGNVTDQDTVMMPGGETIKKLSDMLPNAYKKIRIVQNTRTVYIEGNPQHKTQSINEINGDARLTVAFKQNVVQLINQMYTTHKIPLMLGGEGGGRSFANQFAVKQAAVANGSRAANPGESNHNYGSAVDIGYRNLKWIAGNGTIKVGRADLENLRQVSDRKFMEFWRIRNTIVANIGMHKLPDRAWDFIHIQSYNNNTVSMGKSVVKLLNTVGTMKWSVNLGTPNTYKCDLGYGGIHVAVGNALQIWSQQAPITAQTLAQAGAAGNVTQQQVRQMKTALKGDFESADTGWAQWIPVPR